MEISTAQTIMPFIVVLAMLATATVLAFGVVTLFVKTKGGPRFSNKLMRWRIILQAIALLLFVIFLALR
ncbi:MAG: twin transmembrane helix small protein [Dongiaceae bacterium]